MHFDLNLDRNSDEKHKQENIIMQFDPDLKNFDDSENSKNSNQSMQYRNIYIYTQVFYIYYICKKKYGSHSIYLNLNDIFGVSWWRKRKG